MYDNHDNFACWCHLPESDEFLCPHCEAREAARADMQLQQRTEDDGPNGAEQ